MNILDAIGNSPLLDLKRVVPPGCARVVAKFEPANPTGSMKDRMARAIIERAEADGRLKPGGTVVEYTSGTTGVSLAFVCAIKCYKIRIVFSDAFSEDKGLMMRALGAEITMVPSFNRGITENVIKKMIQTADRLSQEPGHWWSDQLNNKDAIQGYVPLGKSFGNRQMGI